jgi:hypothetical protein
VIAKGTVLQLRADGIPANKLRFVQLNTKSPRFHVVDYARVAVGTDGRLTASPGALSLTRGARLAVLDRSAGRRDERVRLHRGRLQLRSRYAEPSRPDGGGRPDRGVAVRQLRELRRRIRR